MFYQSVAVGLLIAYILIIFDYANSIKVDSKIDIPETSTHKHHLHYDQRANSDVFRSPGIVSAVLEVNLVPSVKAKGSICVKGKNDKCTYTEEDGDKTSEEPESSDEDYTGHNKRTNVKVVSGLDDPADEVENKSIEENNEDDEDNSQYEDSNETKFVNYGKKKKKGHSIPDVPVYVGSYAGVKSPNRDYSDFNVNSAWNYRKQQPSLYYPQNELPLRRNSVYEGHPPFNTARPPFPVGNYPEQEYKKPNYFRRSAVFDIPDHVENRAHLSPANDYYNDKQVHPLVTNTPRPYHRIEYNQNRNVYLLGQRESQRSDDWNKRRPVYNIPRSSTGAYGQSYWRDLTAVDDKMNFGGDYFSDDAGERTSRQTSTEISIDGKLGGVLEEISE